MNEYRVYLLDDDGRIFRAHEIRASDHRAAIKAALPHCESHPVEVWHGAECIAKFEKGCSPVG